MNKGTIRGVKLIFVALKRVHGKNREIKIKIYITFERLKINWFPLKEMFIQYLVTYCANFNEIGEMLAPQICWVDADWPKLHFANFLLSPSAACLSQSVFHLFWYYAWIMSLVTCMSGELNMYPSGYVTVD